MIFSHSRTKSPFLPVLLASALVLTSSGIPALAATPSASPVPVTQLPPLPSRLATGLADTGASTGTAAIKVAQRRGRGGGVRARGFGGRGFSGRSIRRGPVVRGPIVRRGGPVFRGNRGGRRYRGGGNNWVGPAIGLGIAAIILGGSYQTSKARYRDRWERCADRYRTFRWSDGTYIPYEDGGRVLCPLLRR